MKERSHFKQKGQGFRSRPHKCQKKKKARVAEDMKYKCHWEGSSNYAPWEMNESNKTQSSETELSGGSVHGIRNAWKGSQVKGKT